MKMGLPRPGWCGKRSRGDGAVKSRRVGTGLFGDTAARGGTRRPRGSWSGPLGASSGPPAAPRARPRWKPVPVTAAVQKPPATAEAVPCRAGLCRSAPRSARRPRQHRFPPPASPPESPHCPPKPDFVWRVLRLGERVDWWIFLVIFYFRALSLRAGNGR